MGTLLLLQTRSVIRAEDIAAHFEISLRTVYRDVSALSEIGVPVVAEAGVGYSLMKGYLLPPIMFSEEEAAALGMAALALSKSSDPSLDAVTQSALLKVRAALPQRQRERLDRVEQSVAFGWNADRNAARECVARLVDLQRCLAESRALRIDYRSGGRGETTTREVEPLGLVHYLEHWHLIAWCRVREDYRDFRLDRIQKVEVLEERVAPRVGFDLQEYLNCQRDLPEVLQARILFSGHAVGRAKREWSSGLVKEEEVDGGSVLTLSAGAWDWMTGWLLSFRENATVLEPAQLRRELREAARKVAKHHAAEK